MDRKTTSKVFLEQMKQQIETEGVNLIYEFFVTFSRFEFALKASGFAKGDVTRVKPDWDKFTSIIEENFENAIKTKTVSRAIEYLTNHPPKRQNYANGVLGWKAIDQHTDGSIVFHLSSSIRTIRNNLFHGGKFNGIYEKDTSRNYLLLKHSIAVLDFWLEFNNSVKVKFLEQIS